MADFLTKEHRSALMSRIRNRGTAAERFVRHAVWHAGFRYRLNVRKLPGAPDLVLRRYRTAVLVQGCFWHGHTCRKGQKRPATNTEFWNKKLDGNIARDDANQAKLKELDWTVFVIWECRLEADTSNLLTHLRRRRDDLNTHQPPNKKRTSPNREWLEMVRKRRDASQTRITATEILEMRDADRK